MEHIKKARWFGDLRFAKKRFNLFDFCIFISNIKATIQSVESVEDKAEGLDDQVQHLEILQKHENWSFEVFKSQTRVAYSHIGYECYPELSGNAKKVPKPFGKERN